MNILTFDIEDWFHILGNKYTENPNNWNTFESRVEEYTDLILDFLKTRNLNATFFVLGWIAEKYPNLIKKISENGYEIGSHTYFHPLLYNKSKIEVDQEIKSSIDILENLIGKKVTSFRAPGFSIKQKNLWVFESLINHGIEIDSSLFPALRSHGGVPSINLKKPSLLDCSGMIIKEYPINTISRVGIVFSGGGYFRIIPYYFIKKFTIKSPYNMAYFHPRDFDYDQPRLTNLGWIKKFKTYTGLKNTYNKLSAWVDDFNFISISEADKLIDWNKQSPFKLY